MLGKKNTRSAAHGRGTQLRIPSPSLSAIDNSDEDSSEGGMEEASDDGYIYLERNILSIVLGTTS